MSFILLLVGFIFLIKGADYFVEGSSNIAKKFKISPMIIGLTIVAMGTSMPELSVSITSSLIGKNDMSLANVVGSNIFNILLILGVSSVVNPLMVNIVGLIDVLFMIVSSVLLYLFVRKNKNLNRYQGITFILLYVGYIIYTIIR